MSVQIALMLKDLVDKEKAKVSEAYGGLKTGAGVLGGVLQGTSALPGREPNVGQSTFGGALSGFASGGILGAVAGAGMGYMSGSSELENYLLGLNEEQEANITSKTLQPTSFKDGGEVQLVGIQTEKGEVMLLPSTLEIVKVAANKTHKQMDDDEITDFVEEGAIVFSASKDNKFDPSKLEDITLGTSAAHYEENEIFPGEEFKVGNIFGNAKTYSEAANKLKSKISVVEDKKDIFDEVTNAENKITRMLYLNELIKDQDKGNGGKSPQIFGLGGKVKKYENGSSILNSLGSSAGIPPFLAKFLTPEVNKKKGGVEDDYFSNVENKLSELGGLNKSLYSEGLSDIARLDDRIGGSLAASLGTSTLFNALQDHTTRPVIQDTTFINESFQNPSLSLIESQVGSLRGGVNDMAQLLASNGVDPKKIPAILANQFESGLDAEAKMRTSFIQDRNRNDQGRYAALRDNLVSNKKNVIDAQESTKENFNQKLANFGSGINKYLGDKRELDLGQFRAKRNLQKGYLDSDINLLKTNAGIEGKKLEVSDTMRRIQERLDRLNSAKDVFDIENEMRRRDVRASSVIPTLSSQGIQPTSSPIDIESILRMIGQ